MPEPSAAPEHAAPPAYRPLSAGAVTALVLAILLAIPALLGVWWLEAVPLLLVVLAWSGISSGRRRGRGVAVFAGVLAVAVGATSYFAMKAYVAQLETDFDRLLTALEKDDRQELAKWVVKDAEVDPTVTRWVASYAATRARGGAYASRTIVRPGFLGPLGGLFSVPEGIVDATDATRAVPGVLRAVWFEAAFPNARVWVAGVMFPDDAEVSESDASAALEGMSDGGHFRFRDVRFFVQRPD